MLLCITSQSTAVTASSVMLLFTRPEEAAQCRHELWYLGNAMHGDLPTLNLL